MRVIIIIAIVFICGSLKPKIQPCSKEITATFYLNKKYVKTIKQDFFYFTDDRPKTWRYRNKTFVSDSVTIEFKTP